MYLKYLKKIEKKKKRVYITKSKYFLGYEDKRQRDKHKSRTKVKEIFIFIKKCA